MAATSRYADPLALLGPELFAKISEARLLVVGAGGIGCELIKNLVLTGFKHMEVLDLDTIDLSNLNRQFLFRKQHVKRPKAVVARETALKFNPHVDIKALHRNIKDAEFSVSYFSSFDIVLNALDNLDARRHVNKMCLAAGVPLVESGTSGYLGQVQPILNGPGFEATDSECFDCTPKPVPKTFAVCTIRSTPSTAHHCIAWAKTYLFPQLFGADETDNSELEDAEKAGENKDEIAELRKENEAIKGLKATLKEDGAPERVFRKVYETDIARLLKMEDLWKHRKPPHTLSFDELAKAEVATSNGAEANGATAEAPKIKDQRTLSLKDSYDLFLDSLDRLCKRIDPSAPLSWDKDDDDALDFVTAAANLRASAFDIESQTRFQVKEYAGNIIAAIATTNAVIAGVIVLQAINVLRLKTSPDAASAKVVYFSRRPDHAFSAGSVPPKNKHCPICTVVYASISATATATLGDFVKEIVGGKLGFEFVSIQEGTRILFETEDFEDNGAKTLAELGIAEGGWLTVVDSDEDHVPVSFAFGAALPADSAGKFTLLRPLPEQIPMKAAPPVEKKDDSDSDDDVEMVVEGAAPAPAPTGSKKRTADEAGIETNGNEKKSKKIEEDENGVIVLD